MVVQQADFDQVSQVHPIFVAEGRELDAHQRVEGDYPELPGILGLAHIRVGEQFLWSYFFVREDYVNRFARLGVRAIEKEVQAGRVAVDETRGFESRSDGGQILAADQYVNILRVADGGFVNAGNP